MSGEPLALQPLEHLAVVNPATLSQATDPSTTFDYVDLSVVNRGKIDWGEVASYRFFAAPSRARRLVMNGDVLYGTVRPGNQSHAFVSEREKLTVASTGFAVIRAVPNKAEPRFLFHAVLGNSVSAQARTREVGSNYPAITERDVRAFLVAVLPLPEQRRIAEILDTLDEAIRKTEQVIAKLQQMKQGLLHDLLTRGIDENGELRDPLRHPEQFKDSPLGRIPKEWEVAPCCRLCSVITKGTTPSKEDMWEGDGGLPFLRVDNLTFTGRLDLSASNFRVSPKTHHGFLARSRLRPGDVLTNIVGPPLGKLGIIPAGLEEANMNQAIALFRPNERVSSKFLCTWLGSPGAQRWLRTRAKQTSGQVNLTLALCQELPVPILTRGEGERLVSALEGLNARIDAESVVSDKLRLLKQGLMDDLLTGRVRVKVTEAAE